MTSPNISEILEYANLQMAAEAFLANPADPTGSSLKSNIRQALIDGNFHASVFTATQSDAFLKHRDKLAQHGSR